MSWIRRITVICDSCWLCFTLRLSEDGNDTLGMVTRNHGIKALRIDGQLWHLCPVCHEAAKELDEAALKELLLSGLHVSGQPLLELKRKTLHLSEVARQHLDDKEAQQELIEPAFDE